MYRAGVVAIQRAFRYRRGKMYPPVSGSPGLVNGIDMRCSRKSRVVIIREHYPPPLDGDTCSTLFFDRRIFCRLVVIIIIIIVVVVVVIVIS